VYEHAHLDPAAPGKGQRPPFGEVLRCPVIGVHWLRLDLTGTGAIVLLRGELEDKIVPTCPDGPRRTTGFYL